LVALVPAAQEVELGEHQISLAMGVQRVIRHVANRFPSLATAAFVYQRLRKSKRAFSRAGEETRGLRELVRESPDGRVLELTPEELVDLRIGLQPLVAWQKRQEIIPALEQFERLRPQRVCEIGTAAGGTLYLLTRVSAPDALVVSIDLAISPHTRVLRERLARPGQRIVSLAGDSHSEETALELERLLDGKPLDALFIDGDHSYDGVRTDFERYGRLVRSGGIIALHDVNEDFRTRHGIETQSFSGEVPRFWRELKERHRTEELIADPEQDGFGIGLVYV
jgi:predicted O-methyltransferase YrrM